MASKFLASLRQILDSPQAERLLRPSYPPFAVDVAAGRLLAVAVRQAGGRTSLLERRIVELPAGVVVPSLLRPAILDLPRFTAALREAVDGLPGLEGRLSMVLPDHVAKISFVELDAGASPYSAETAEIIRWKIKRSTPFRVEDGRIAYHPFARARGGYRCLVSLVQSQVVQQFEEVAAALGLELGLVDLASFNLWNLIESSVARAEGDSLLLNIDDGYGTAMIVRAGEPLFVRCKTPTSVEAAPWEAFREELHPTLLYYQDRLRGEGIRRAFIRATARVAAELATTLQSVGIPWERLPIPIAGTEALESDELTLLAPSLGAAMGR